VPRGFLLFVRCPPPMKSGSFKMGPLADPFSFVGISFFFKHLARVRLVTTWGALLHLNFPPFKGRIPFVLRDAFALRQARTRRFFFFPGPLPLLTSPQVVSFKKPPMPLRRTPPPFIFSLRGGRSTCASPSPRSTVLGQVVFFFFFFLDPFSHGPLWFRGQ